jgi:hypothetical protein
MDTSMLILALIVVFGCLNVLPWVFLCVNRPDRSIMEQLQDSDASLAMICQHLLDKVDSFSSPMASANENPLMTIISAFMEQRLNGANTISRDDQGQFNGTQIEAETTQTRESDFFDGTG